MPKSIFSKSTLFLAALALLIFYGCTAQNTAEDSPNGGAILWEKTLIAMSETDSMNALRSGLDNTIEIELTRKTSRIEQGKYTYITDVEGDIIDIVNLQPIKSDVYTTNLHVLSEITTQDGGGLYAKPKRDNKYVLFHTELTRKDAKGQILWTKKLKGQKNKSAHYNLFSFQMIEQENGDVIIAGHENGERDVRFLFFTRINQQGDILWHVRADQDPYPSKQGADRITKLIQLKDGTLIALGHHEIHRNIMNRDAIPLIIRLTADGKTLTRRTFYIGKTSKNFTHLSKLEPENGTGYLLTGNNFVMQLDDDLNPVWQKKMEIYGSTNPSIDEANLKVSAEILGQTNITAETLANGNTVIGGNLFEAGAQLGHPDHHTDMFLMMVDPTGEPLWFRRYDRSDKLLLRDMLITQGENGPQAVLLLSSLPKERAKRGKRFKRSSYLMKVDLTQPPIDADGNPLAQNLELVKTHPLPVGHYGNKEIVETRDGLENYAAKLTIGKSTNDNVADVCRQLLAALPTKYEDLFVPHPTYPFQETHWAPWGNMVPNIDPFIETFLRTQNKLKWEKVTSAAENRDIHQRIGSYIGQQYYEYDGKIDTQRGHMKFPLPTQERFMAAYDAEPPEPRDFYKQHIVGDTGYVFYPGNKTDYPSLNYLELRYEDKAFKSYDKLSTLDNAFYMDGQIFSITAHGLRVFDPSVAPNEKAFMRQHSRSHRHIQPGPFRQDEGCKIKYLAKEN